MSEGNPTSGPPDSPTMAIGSPHTDVHSPWLDHGPDASGGFARNNSDGCGWYPSEMSPSSMDDQKEMSPSLNGLAHRASSSVMNMNMAWGGSEGYARPSPSFMPASPAVQAFHDEHLMGGLSDHEGLHMESPMHPGYAHHHVKLSPAQDYAAQRFPSMGGMQAGIGGHELDLMGGSVAQRCSPPVSQRPSPPLSGGVCSQAGEGGEVVPVQQVQHQLQAPTVQQQETVLLFDEARSTYLCIIHDADTERVSEYYRTDENSPWQVVDRLDKGRCQAYQDAGVPKTIPWTGPRIVVYTFGKQEIGRGGEMNKPTLKYYQWCNTCCFVGCRHPVRGCTKSKCWVAPRKWKQHCSSQRHVQAVETVRELQNQQSGMQLQGVPGSVSEQQSFHALQQEQMEDMGQVLQNVVYQQQAHKSPEGTHPCQQHTQPPPHTPGFQPQGYPTCAADTHSHTLDNLSPRTQQSNPQHSATPQPVSNHAPPHHGGTPQGGAFMGGQVDLVSHQAPWKPSSGTEGTNAYAPHHVASYDQATQPGSVGRGGEWHQKLQLLQSENEALKGRVDSLNSAIRTYVTHAGSSDGTSSWAPAVVDNQLLGILKGLDDESEGSTPLGAQGNKGVSFDLGKRELVAMRTDDTEKAVTSGGGGYSAVQGAESNKRARLSSHKEVLLVFDGDLHTCDREAISAKLRHLKRLLAKRFEAKQHQARSLAGANGVSQLAMKVLLALPGSVDPHPDERIRVLVSTQLPAAKQDRIRAEMIAVCAFVSDLHLQDNNVRFVCMDEGEDDESEMCAHAQRGGATQSSGTHTQRGVRVSSVQIVIIGFNHGGEDEKMVDDLTLGELCQTESVTWTHCGSEINVCWCIRDLEPVKPEEQRAVHWRDKGGKVVVCNPAKRETTITLYFPEQLVSFFVDEGLHRALEPGNFLNKVLADDVGEIHFLEWKQGSVRVPCIMSTRLATMLWDLLRRRDTELVDCLVRGLHSLCAIEIDGWAIDVSGVAKGLAKRGPLVSCHVASHMPAKALAVRGPQSCSVQSSSVHFGSTCSGGIRM